MLQNKFSVHDTRIEAIESRISLVEERLQCNFDYLVNSEIFDQNIDDRVLLRNAKLIGKPKDD